jgi:REP-associated tyrosine transposase
MSRELRIEVPGGIYHVGSRGNRGCVVYEDDFERRMFLRLLSLVTKRFAWKCHAYVLMSNHFHLLVQLDVGGLSDGMQLLNGCFAKFSNTRNGHVGQHLFRNRFWSEQVVDDAQLLQTARYIVLNPVRAHICDKPEDWPWSSYRACAGIDFAPSFLAMTRHLRLFGVRPSAASRAYREFVREGLTAARHPVSDTVTEALRR